MLQHNATAQLQTGELSSSNIFAELRKGVTHPIHRCIVSQLLGCIQSVVAPKCFLLGLQQSSQRSDEQLESYSAWGVLHLRSISSAQAIANMLGKFKSEMLRLEGVSANVKRAGPSYALDDDIALHCTLARRWQATMGLWAALAAVAVPGADTARVATAPFGAGLAHIGPRGSRKPPRATPAQVTDTISDTDSRVSELAYLTPRAADGTGTPPGEGCDGTVAPTAPDASTPERRRRQVRRCPFNRCRSSSKLCDVRCTTSHGTSAANKLLALHATLAGWRRPPWRSRAPYADTWPALVTTLAASAPVRATDLAAAIWSAAEADADPGATTEDCTHVCTCVGAQPTARMTLRQLSSPRRRGRGRLFNPGHTVGFPPAFRRRDARR